MKGLNFSFKLNFMSVISTDKITENFYVIDKFLQSILKK